MAKIEQKMISAQPIFTRLNFTLGLILALFNLCFLVVFPLVIHNPWGLLFIAIVNGLLTTPFWSLIHEAIHRVFNPNKQVNDTCARIMAILFGTIFPLVQFGHLMHHRMNRQGPDLVDAYFPGKDSVVLKTVQYYLHIFGGLYLTEVIIPLLVFLPLSMLDKLVSKALGEESPYYKVAKIKLLTPKMHKQMRVDAICLYILLIIAFALYGKYFWILLIGLLLRGFMISFADNLPHYGTPIDKPRYAYNTFLPKPLRYYWFNFNLHRVHHENPGLPWNQLYKVFQERNDYYDIGYFRQALRQLRGIWPVEAKPEEKNG